MLVKNKNNYEIDFDAAVYFMNDTIRKELHAEYAENITEQDFFTIYEKAHTKKQKEEWELSKRNPTW